MVRCFDRVLQAVPGRLRQSYRARPGGRKKLGGGEERGERKREERKGGEKERERGEEREKRRERLSTRKCPNGV